MHKKIIVAIDGYSSCGKSTVAKELARRLQYIYLDSGAMYRAVTLFFIENNIDINNQESVANALNQIQITFRFSEKSGFAETFLNGVNVEEKIREMKVAEKVSEVSAIKTVRNAMVIQQRMMGKEKAIVLDGRDIGTVVFPDAELKIFMTANKDIRAKRRFDELIAKGIGMSMEEVKRNIEQRDFIDTTRKESPLRQAADAVVLDNSTLSREEQLEFVVRLAHERINS